MEFIWFVFIVEKRLVEEVRNHHILIIVGETGSGKTTRKFLLFFFLVHDFSGVKRRNLWKKGIFYIVATYFCKTHKF